MTVNQVQALIFDLDGTLASSLQSMKDSYFNFVLELGGVPSNEEFESLNGPPLSEIVGILKHKHQFASSETSLLATYMQNIEKTYLSNSPTKGAINLLHSAGTLGLKLGLVTSNSRNITTRWLEENHILNLFSTIVTGEDVEKGKPHPDPYLKAIKELSIRANQAVVFEDSEQGYLSATSAGLRTIIVSQSMPNWHMPANCLIVSDFDEIELETLSK